MSPLTFWLGRAACAGFVSALAVSGHALFARRDAAGRRALARYLAELGRKLRFLRSATSASAVLLGQGLLGLLALAASFVRDEPLICLLVPGIAFLPRVVLEKRAADRVTKLEAQIEPWLNAIANALKASPSLGEAIAASTSLVGAPISQEVDVVMKEYELGTPLDRALDQFAQRVGSKTLHGCVLALKIARRSGGNLPALLEQAAAALREMARLEGVVRTKTAEGKAQAFVIGMIPIPLVLVINGLDPEFLRPLITTFNGHLILGVAVALWAAAVLLAHKILAVDI